MDQPVKATRKRGRPPKTPNMQASTEPLVSTSVYEDDEKLARAIQASLDIQERQQQEDYEQLRRAQEEADNELAKQLMQSENSLTDASYHYSSDNDMNTRATSSNQASSNAYSAPLSVDNILADIDESAIKIKQQLLKKAEWDAIREEQDAEYQASLLADQLRADQLRADQLRADQLQAEQLKETSIEEDDIPKTREELRNARMAFFLKK